MGLLHKFHLFYAVNRYILHTIVYRSRNSTVYDRSIYSRTRQLNQVLTKYGV